MKTITLPPEDLLIVRKIMQKYPQTVVFGSRVKGTSQKFSDLDLCIKDQISGYDYELLKEAFENSDLPIRVDLIIYSRCDESFQKVIDSQSIPLF